MNSIKREAKGEQVRSFFRQARLEYVVKNIYHILRVLTLLLYVGINVYVLYTSISKVTYFTSFERVTFLNMLLLLSITLLIPGILILVLFVKKDFFVLNIAKMIPFVLILGLLVGSRTPSVTTNYKNYGSYDWKVEELLRNQEFTMLPRKLPSNISDVNYMYRYEAIFDDQYLEFRITWTYDNKKDFEEAKNKMISTINDREVKMENSDYFFYSIGSSIEDKQYFQYGYDDVEKSVSYEIQHEWK